MKRTSAPDPSAANMNMKTNKSARNKTIAPTASEQALYRARLLQVSAPVDARRIENRIINDDIHRIADWLPPAFADILFLDPPYNITKDFAAARFSKRSLSGYADWLDSWLPSLLRTLKPSGSVYICGDWRSSAAVHLVAEKYLTLRNRITWEREKGRGAKRNWKNCSEDIWFGTLSDDYAFNVDAVKLKRRVIAPYTDDNGAPKDWAMSHGAAYRLTHPSNLWTDITVPFWSMPENTPHPAQKPEKLMAKIILASSAPDDMIFDPFLGSGTTAVVAKKLGRRYAGVEINPTYCCLALKRLDMANSDASIQGYSDGVFWERNSYAARRQTAASRSDSAAANQPQIPLTERQ